MPDAGEAGVRVLPTYVNPAPPQLSAGTGSTFNQGLTDGLYDGLVEAGERGEVLPALPLHPAHHGVVLGGPALPGVQQPRLENLRVIHAGDRLGDLVAEVGVAGPPDRALHDGLHDRGG